MVFITDDKKFTFKQINCGNWSEKNFSKMVFDKSIDIDVKIKSTKQSRTEYKNCTRTFKLLDS